MLKLNKYKDIIANVEATHRDIKLEEIFSKETKVHRTANEKFITEISEHLSTIINAEELIKNNYFVIEIEYGKYEYQYETTTRDFIGFLRMLYSEYKGMTGFAPNEVLNPILIEDFNTLRKRV